jgi:hypothetical protein
MSLSMTQSEREEFLAGAHVGVLSVCAGEGQAPSKYVTVEGPAVIEKSDQAERIEIASRYHGDEEGRAFIADNPEIDDIVIRLTPDRWRTADFAKL